MATSLASQNKVFDGVRAGLDEGSWSDMSWFGSVEDGRRPAEVHSMERRSQDH